MKVNLFLLSVTSYPAFFIVYRLSDCTISTSLYRTIKITRKTIERLAVYWEWRLSCWPIRFSPVIYTLVESDAIRIKRIFLTSLSLCNRVKIPANLYITFT